MKLRQHIEQSKFLISLVARIAGAYLSLCNRTTRWEFRGLEELKSELENGPILLLMWHGRLLMAPYHWPLAARSLSSLHDTSPIARVVGALQRQIGLQPMEMSAKLSNIAASRIVLRRVRDGVCIGMAADGPQGPNQQLKDAPLEWARVMRRPIFGYAYAVKRHRILGSWDKMMLPLPFTRGVAVFERFEGSLPTKMDPEMTEAARAGLTALLDGVAAEANDTAN